MKKITSKSELAVVLSKLKGFKSPQVRLEQYPMDSEIGASVLWNAYLLGDIEGKVIVDLGCGTGILGIATLLLGATNVLFVDSDERAILLAKTNHSKVKSEYNEVGIAKFICQDIKHLNIKADVVIQNPPFGTKVRHSDILFLKKAIETAQIVYSFHKSETKLFLEQFTARNNARITHVWDFKFPLKTVFEFHRRKIHRINVSCFRLAKSN